MCTIGLLMLLLDAIGYLIGDYLIGDYPCGK
jgi:hypothetical protein